MSGIEILAGIGILCNAMQIVTFGKDALEVYNHVRENGTADPRLESYLADASKSYQEMKKQLSVSGPLTSDQQEVVKTGEGAHNSLERFRTYFAKLYVDENSRQGFRGRLRVVRSGIKTLFHTKELEDLEKNFERYQQLFQTRLIQRVCSQRDATALIAQQNVANLDITQQSMVKRIAEGHTEMSLLVSQKAVEVKELITNQHSETRSAMGNHLSVTENNLRSHIADSTTVVQQDMASRHKTEHETKKYDQLMASLRYPEMNTRKNQVVKNFPKTFRWIYPNKGDSDDDSSSSASYSSGEDSANEEDTGHGVGPVSQDVSTNEGKGDEKSCEERDEAPGSGRKQEERTSRELYDDDPASTASRSETSARFAEWLGSEAKTFWISGKPGSGKSTLMKFIATNSATQEHVAAWRSDVHILTHYFWKAGSPMERKLKGLLLSLIYQILLDRTALAQQLWETMPAIRHKWSYGDWDMQQLEDTLFWVVEAAEESFLFLIDGLDESEELEKHVYMTDRSQNILDRLAKLRGVKVCVSSREEYTFSHHFENIGRLRIHELTKHDIRRLTSSRLKSMNFANSSDRDRILQLIAEAADGVFLWVILVLQSVTRAFRIDNSVERAIERIKQMPKDLIDVVRDMWERAGEDADLPSYRASASRYFNLALVENGLELFFPYTIASEERSLEDMLDLDRTWDLTELAKTCSRKAKEIPLVSSGLLEVSCQKHELLPLPKALQQYSSMKTRFTHRCVVDFLRDTEDGFALLNACEWTRDEAMARLAGASMVWLRLIDPKYLREPGEPVYDNIFCKKRYIYPTSKYISGIHFYLKEYTDDDDLVTAPYRNFFLRKSYEWYMAGLFYERHPWGCYGRSIFRDDPLKKEFIASMATSARLSVLIKLITSLPLEELLNVLPAIFRGLSIVSDQYYDEEMRKITGRLKRACLTKQVLIRLRGSEDEESSKGIPLKASTRETREDLRRLVCSWFLGSLSTSCDKQYSETTRNEELAVLQLIQLTLPTVEDWNQSVLLYLKYDGSMRGFMHFDPERHSTDCCVVVSLATVYQIFLRFIRRSTTNFQPTGGLSITDEQLPSILSRGELSLRTLLIGEDERSFHLCRKENEPQDSELFLDSLLTGRCLMAEELATVKGRKGSLVAKGNTELMHYLISDLDHGPGLLIHPWSSWLVYDVSEHDKAEDLDAQVDEKSRASFRKVLEEISQDL
ncbi:hypothetical protein LB507_006259 [Fusarium sp. FIESC RH6]|nr:hypothetical protein LB507_006259 [Fusarium sp. FIESC RH6]